MALIVLDTNVVLDWLLFADVGCAALNTALENGELCWIATPAMRDEHFHLVESGRLGAWFPDQGALEAAWTAHCTLVVEPPVAPASALYPRCSDKNDQKFIDLAVFHSASWLLSKDRAVLRLARSMRRFGVGVTTPLSWAQQRG